MLLFQWVVFLGAALGVKRMRTSGSSWSSENSPSGRDTGSSWQLLP